MRVRVKICCISSPHEARQAVAAGADVLGLVSAMPSGPGPIGEDAIAEIVTGVPPGVATMLLTSRTDGAGIVTQLRRTRASVVQLSSTRCPPRPTASCATSRRACASCR
jgi:phosphoribosylanthranilate isomerase